MPWHRGTALMTAPPQPYSSRKSGSCIAVPAAQNQMPFAPSLPSARRFSVTGIKHTPLGSQWCFTASGRNEGLGSMYISAARSAAENSGSLLSAATTSSASCPAMEPAEWERMRFSS